MQLVPQHRLFPVPTTTIMKKIVLSVAVVSTLILTGCASKPQINNPTRYATAPDYYTVRSGDTLSGIAARYGLSYLSIAEMNDISAPYRIYVNQSACCSANTAACNHNYSYDCPSNQPYTEHTGS